MQDLNAWHKDQKIFDASNKRQEDDKTVYLPGMQKQWSKNGPSSEKELIKWVDFRSFLKKCHRKLGQCFIDCIEAGDFMHVYNAVLILKEIIDVFPLASVNEVAGSNLDRVMQRLVQHEERGDLKILAISYVFSLLVHALWLMIILKVLFKPQET